MRKALGVGVMANDPKILVVDDEPSILSVLSTILRAEDLEVDAALGGEKALELLGENMYDLLLSDLRMSPVDGMELLSHACENHPHMPVIMVTAYGSVETAVDAMKRGAFDYVTKPFKVDELMLTVKRALQYSRALQENRELRARLSSSDECENIVAESAEMRHVCEMIHRVADSDATVLIYGESGTGKELVARAIHANSPRSRKNFMAINCAALPEALLESEMFGHVKGAFTGASSDKQGLFEAAGGGTILLDEISSMPLSLQSKLLRVLQEKEVRKVGSTETVPIDVRVLAATNEPLDKSIEEGRIREDLYYRLNVITIEIPPLRNRRDDILPLVYHFLAEEKQGERPLPDIDPDAQMALEQYPWPGNVRELENAVRHACTFADGNQITLGTLPGRVVKQNAPGAAEREEAGAPSVSYTGQSLKSYLRAREKEYLRKAIEEMDGDKAKAARALKISLATLYRKLPEPVD